MDCLSAFQLKEREQEGGGGKCIHMHLSDWESERTCRFIPFCVYCWAFFSGQCLWPNFDQILIYMLMVKIWQGHWLNVNIWNQFLNNNCFKTKLRITAIWLPHQVSKHTNQPLKLKQEYISNFTTIFICLYERLQLQARRMDIQSLKCNTYWRLLIARLRVFLTDTYHNSHYSCNFVLSYLQPGQHIKSDF